MAKEIDRLDGGFVQPTISINAARKKTPQQTVKQAISGDRLAIRSLIHTLTPVIQTSIARALSGFNLRIHDCHGHSDIADYCQDVFMHLFDNEQRVLKSWDPAKGMSLTNFVSLVAKRRVISSLRTSKNYQRLDDELIEQRVEAELNSTSEEYQFLERNYLLRIIQALKKTISDVGYDVFIQLFLYELSVSEVSEKTGISKNAIYVWKNRLRNQVRTIASKLNDQRTSTQESQKSPLSGQRTSCNPSQKEQIHD